MAESIIQQIVNIENSTKDITREIEETKNNLDKIIAEKQIEIREKIGKETEQTINALKTKAEDDSRNRILEMSSAAQANYAKLEIEYENNKDIWINEILESIIS